MGDGFDGFPEDDDEDETASTQAVDMSDVHAQIQKQMAAGLMSPVPGLPSLPGMAPPPPQPGPARAGDKKAFNPSPSGIMSVVGGFFVFLSLMMGWYSGAWVADEMFDDFRKGQRAASDIIDGDAELDDIKDEELRNLVEAQIDIMEALGMDSLREDLKAADSRADKKEIIKSWTVSPLGLARAMMTVDFNAEELSRGMSESKLKEAKAVIRGFWWSIFALWFVTIGIMVLAGIRRLAVLNTWQLAINGLFGFCWTVAGLGLILSDEKHRDLEIFAGFGRYLVLVGGLILWISAFAGMTKENWWKALLLGPLVLIIYVIIVGIPIGLAFI